MYCNNCGNKISKEAKFCQHCGLQVVNQDTKTENQSNDKPKSSNDDKKQKTLWNIFSEIYDSRGDERNKYLDQSSNEVWVLINRISTNSFENFISTYKEQLNKQPYKSIEIIKDIVSYCTSGGYFFWMAENLLKNDELKSLKSINQETLISDWKDLSIDNYKSSSEKISEDLMNSMDIFLKYELKTLFNEAPTIKDVTNEVIDELKRLLIMHIFWGYFGGIAEAKFRK